MEKVAQQEHCLLFALIDITGRRCSKLQASQVAILKGNIYRMALSAEKKDLQFETPNVLSTHSSLFLLRAGDAK